MEEGACCIMLQSKARWLTGEADEQLSVQLAQSLSIPLLAARLLVSRGITDPLEADQFINGGEQDIHDPLLLDGMEAAVDRIRAALAQREKIRVYGDYDADGVSSTSLMIHLLRRLGADFDSYIPHRMLEGYGLNNAAIDKAKASGVSLLITVDTGVSAVSEIAYAKELGIDVIVTDHHEPPDQLPEPYALVNPKKPGCPYPYKQLAGVGVALKLAQALLGRWPEELLEYAVIGTVADLMPLTGENRVIVRQGLGQMRSTSNPGIKALLKVSGIAAREVNETHIGFALGPRINASGRLLSADTAVRLLTTESPEEAEVLAAELDALNKERQQIVEQMTKEAVQMAENKKKNGEWPKVMVLASPDWNVGVIGIAASKIVERCYRPTIVLGIDSQTGAAKGSARSIAGFDMHKALSQCADLMDHFGGHPMAAGMTLHSSKLEELEQRLCRIAEESLAADDYIPIMKADLCCSLQEASAESIRYLEKLAPFGTGNPSPRFLFTGLSIRELRTMGKEQQHLKIALEGEESAAPAVDAVGFGKGHYAALISPSTKLDVIGELSMNEWNGVRKPQIMLHDLRVPHPQVFDHRGHPRPALRLTELCNQAALASSSARLPAVITFASDDSLQPALPVQASWWRMTGLHSIEPLNEHASEQSLHLAEDLVLYTMPGSLEQLRALIKAMPSVQRYYVIFDDDASRSGERFSVPSRELFKQVYVSLHAASSEAQAPAPVKYIEAISRRSGLSQGMVSFIIDVFEELGLAARDPETGGYRTLQTDSKRDLTASVRYQERLKREEAESVLLYASNKELTDLLLDSQSRSTA